MMDVLFFLFLAAIAYIPFLLRNVKDQKFWVSFTLLFGLFGAATLGYTIAYDTEGVIYTHDTIEHTTQFIYQNATDGSLTGTSQTTQNLNYNETVTLMQLDQEYQRFLWLMFHSILSSVYLIIFVSNLWLHLQEILAKKGMRQ